MKQSQLFSGLKLKRQIETIFKQGKKVYAPNCYIRWIKLDEPMSTPWLVLFAVPRNLKSAVKRNRLKRIMRATLFECLKGLPIPNTSIALAIFAKENFITLPPSERLSQFQKICRQIPLN